MSISVTSRHKLYIVFYRFSTNEVGSNSSWGHKCIYALFSLHIFLNSLRHKADRVAVRISTAC